MAGETSIQTGDTLILGVGNPLLGDDAVGVLAVQQLQERTDLPPDVTVVDGGTDGLGLVPLIESYRRVILVDAVQMGLSAGTIRRFTWQEARFVGHGQGLSLHQSDLTDAMALAEALHCLPQEVVVYGIQPHTVDLDRPLSTAVERALPALIDALINEVMSDN
ncbi:MAG TPA: hydrogenase maturation protease [Aggregatilineaceae bacterium]|nr:hydrogenase maturation protease [Aggregatilineaceae bacterium]